MLDNDFTALDEQDLDDQQPEETQETDDLDEDDTISGDPEDAEEEEVEEVEEEESEEEAEKEPEVAEPEPTKPTQTPEENAYYAEMRRQQQAAQRQMEIQQAIQQTPEYQLAQMLQTQYGMSTPQIVEALQREQLAKEAEALGVNPQQLAWQRQQQAQMEQQQQAMMQYNQLLNVQNFMARLNREGQEVMQTFPQLTPDDLTDAVLYMHQNNVAHLPLMDVVKVKYADRIYSMSQEEAKQQALAQVSGRANRGVKPPSGKAAPSPVKLTEAEAYFAKQYNMTAEEYRQWQKG